MGEFIIKRLLLCVLILFFVMFIVYALMFSLPTSYVDTMARARDQARQPQERPGMAG